MELSVDGEGEAVDDGGDGEPPRADENVGRYGDEMWGDVGRCGEMWGDLGRSRT